MDAGQPDPTDFPPSPEATPAAGEPPAGAPPAGAPPAGSVAGPAARRPGVVDLVAGALLAATVVLHVVAMIPSYYTGSGGGPLVSQPDQAALYAVLAAAWALALAIGATGPARTPVAAGLAVGIAATELGFRVADIGYYAGHQVGGAGAGLWIMTAAWVVGAAGAALAVVAARRRSGDAQRARHRGATIGAVAALALLTAWAFLPAWNHYHAAAAATGQSTSFNLGDAWSGPWEVVLGNILVAVALASIPIAALVMCRPSVGAAAVGGVLAVLATQFTAAVVQVDQAVSPSILGISAGQARQEGLTVTMKLTEWFTIDALAALALLVVVMAVSTATVVQANSAGAVPRAPAARREATFPSS